MARANAERAAYARAWRKKKTAEGLCNRCGKRPAENGRKTCGPCYEAAHAAYLVAKEAKTHLVIARKSKGLCTSCGAPIDPSDTYNGRARATCDACRARKRRKSARKRNTRYPEILERDGYRCQICGRTSRLSVHHKDGNGETKDGKRLRVQDRNDDPDNLITLCQYCHYSLTVLRRDGADRELAATLLLY